LEQRGKSSFFLLFLKFPSNKCKPENVTREVIASSEKDAITIATNMAGRGTDIILGGNTVLEAKTI
jgi:preprotein translocase subunit SecA